MNGAPARSWFVVLPDNGSAEQVAGRLGDLAARRISHASGRAWLLGCWDEAEVTEGQAGPTRVVLIGQHAATAEDLTRAAGRIRTVSDADRLARRLTGASHLLVSAGGLSRVQGTISSVRRVFHAVVDGVTVAADQAHVLGGLLGGEIDEEALALHLLDPNILYPLAGRPVWRGVQVLPGDRYLVLEGSQPVRQVRWWEVPEPVVPMSQGAVALREALSTAVEARTRGRDLVSSDLGGLDSTAVCSLAARGEAPLVAYTAASIDPHADDVHWSHITVAGLGNVEHHIVPAEEMPLVYHGLLGREDLDGRLDEPCPLAVDRDRVLVIARRAAERGSRLHLAGLGGDEMLYGSVAHLHAMLRRQPRLAWRHLRGFSAKYRWPRGRVLRQLLDNSAYHVWLGRVADRLTEPQPGVDEPLFDWGFEPRLPPWTAPDTVASVRALIREEAHRGTPPLAGTHGQHRELESIRFVSRIARQLGQMVADFGIAYGTPYYDDRALEAALSVRPQERVSPWRYKPLILEAMRGIVPEESRVRQTKAAGTCDEDPGLRRHRAELLELWEDSRLHRLGLIDASAVRTASTRPQPLEEVGEIYQTVACELWLRAHMSLISSPGRSDGSQTA
ncbi:asparagine synthase-related protein [Actinomadura fulvescens]|uniref:Lasso peptide isopeptide bond-forming cyclase n=1 Tax=Actinomadura fulvescens TaxID=46160 RepID=A0ABN3QFS7_9ACTN